MRIVALAADQATTWGIHANPNPPPLLTHTQIHKYLHCTSYRTRTAYAGLWQLSNSGHRKTGSKDLLELPLVRRTRQPWQVGSRGAVRDGEADILGRMQGYLWYAADVCADLTAMALDELLLLLGEGAAGPTAADGGEKEDARGSGAGAGAEAAFLVLTGCCALFLSAMYFVVLPLVWLLLNAMDGAKEDEAAADPPLHEHEHEHVD